MDACIFYYGGTQVLIDSSWTSDPLMNAEIWQIWRSPISSATSSDLVAQWNEAEVLVDIIILLCAVSPALHAQIYLCKNALFFTLTHLGISSLCTFFKHSAWTSHHKRVKSEAVKGKQLKKHLEGKFSCNIFLSIYFTASTEAPLWYLADQSEMGAAIFPGCSWPHTISVKLCFFIGLWICIIYEVPSGKFLLVTERAIQVY